MRARMTYELDIAMRGRDGRWWVAVARSAQFDRSPMSTARSIAERWIFEETGELPGGRLLVVGQRHRLPQSFDASVRIRILDKPGGRQLAAAYIGIDCGRGRTPTGSGRDHYLPAAMVLAGDARA
jgi:hypothetical protein